MKNFLKSTAIFACVALLFCACGEDNTEDITIPGVAASGIRSVTPGNGKFEIKWVVAPNEHITRCRVSWSNADGSVTGDWVAKADFTQPMIYTTTKTLPAGKYTVTLENFGDDKLDSGVATRTINVYDATSFTSPTIIGAAVETATEGVNVLFEWDCLPEDCTGVFMTYTKADGDTETTKLTSFDDAAFVEGVEAGSSYSYTTCFKPEGGLDEVMYNTKNAGTIPSAGYAPEAPSAVMVNSGDYKFKVSADNSSNAARAVVKYVDGDTSYYKYFDTEGAADFEAFVEELPLAKYAVSMRYISGESMSSEVKGDSYAVVYDLAAYTESCSTPEYISVFYDNDFSGTTENHTEFSQPYCINWKENPDCVESKMTYTTSANGDIVENYDITAEAASGSTTVVKDIVAGSEFIINTTFAPAGNGLDKVVKELVMKTPYAPVPKFIYSWGGGNGCVRNRHYFINLIGDDSGMDGSEPNKTKGSQLHGEATLIGNGVNEYYFEELFDDAYDYTMNSTSMYRRQYNADGNYTVADQTVSYDLGATFQLKSIIYTPHLAQMLGGTTIKSFSLYGTDKDPLTTDGLNIATAATKDYIGTEWDYMVVPDLSNWDCLLSRVEIKKPSLNNIDYNGDGIVDVNDDSDYIMGGISFDIPTTAKAVRYLRLQVHSTVGGTNQFWIMELDHLHSGCVSGYDGDAYQNHNVLNTNVGSYYPGVVRNAGVVLENNTTIKKAEYDATGFDKVAFGKKYFVYFGTESDEDTDD